MLDKCTHLKFSRASIDIAESSLDGDWIDFQLCLFQHIVDSRLRAVHVLKVEISRPDVHALLLLAAAQQTYKLSSSSICMWDLGHADFHFIAKMLTRVSKYHRHYKPRHQIYVGVGIFGVQQFNNLL